MSEDHRILGQKLIASLRKQYQRTVTGEPGNTAGIRCPTSFDCVLASHEALRERDKRRLGLLNFLVDHFGLWEEITNRADWPGDDPDGMWKALHAELQEYADAPS